ncbi:leucine-rich repeat-containing protein 52-like [Clytia hemisphaerica]|uniref:leucine-rich repeat-containing protein 52-like n=1 Tax=Clytia hemisphaerica TaxID=252671 RepID=UPI0034D3DFE0
MEYPKLINLLIFVVTLLPSLVKTQCPSKCSCSGDLAYCENQFLTSIPNGFGSSIRRLYLGANFIETINKGDLPDLPGLEILGLQNNKLTYIQDEAFSGYTSLVQLHLNNNFLRRISNSTFKGLENVIILNLHNQLTDNSLFIDDYTFGNMSNLNELNLQNTNLKQITDHTLDGFKRGALYLQGQDIHRFSPYAFSGIHNDASIFIDSKTSRLCCCESKMAISDTSLSLNCIKNDQFKDYRVYPLQFLQILNEI